jgi:hypothetical protein
MWNGRIPKTWGDWHTKLRKRWLDWQNARFPNTRPMTEGQMKVFLYNTEREYSREVDAIVLRFAQRGRWPNNASNHSYFLARRIEYAMEILSALDSTMYDQQAEGMSFVPHQPVPPPQARPDIIVRWLLVNCWETGRRHWIDQFILSAAKK